MSPKTIDGTIFDPDNSSFENLLSATLYLMSFYNRHSCPTVRRAIRSHLLALAQVTGASDMPTLNETAMKLINSYWGDQEIEFSNDDVDPAVLFH